MSSPYYNVLVQYPANAKFNLDYYTSKHMPLVTEQFGPYGFKGYAITTKLATPDPSVPSPISVLAILYFDSEEAFQNALKAGGEKVLGDIPNFSDQSPTLVGGTTLLSTAKL